MSKNQNDADLLNSKKQTVSSSVANLVTFMKEKTAENLLEAAQPGGHLKNMSREEVELVSTIVNLSLEQAFSTGYVGVDNTIAAVLKDS